MVESAKVVVIGSINMDMLVSTSKMPVEGETILGKSFSMSPGGKGANQAVAAARLGADVTMIGSIGDDENGRTLLKKLQGEGINTSQVTMIDNIPTGIAIVNVLDSGENSITVVPGGNYHLTASHIEKAEDVIKEADICLIQMEIPLDAVRAAVTIANKHHKRIILNPAPAPPDGLPEDILHQVEYLTPNQTELSILATGEVKNDSAVEKNVDTLQQLSPHTRFIVTMGANGVYYSDQSLSNRFEAMQVEAVDTTAAGDSFNAAVAVKLASGYAIEDAISYAVKVSALTVTKQGAQTSLPYKEEVD